MKLWRIIVVASTAVLSMCASESELKKQKAIPPLNTEVFGKELACRLYATGINKNIWGPFHQYKISSKNALKNMCGTMLSILEGDYHFNQKLLRRREREHEDLCKTLPANDPQVIIAWVAVSSVTLAQRSRLASIEILKDIYTSLVIERCQKKSLLMKQNHARIGHARTF